MKLFPYQEDGVRHLMARDRAGLFDEMGLGKTAQTLVAFDRLGLTSALIVVPASLRGNWENECEQWLSRWIEIFVVRTATDPIGDGIVIVSYDLARNKKVWDRLMARRYDVLVLDEAHYLRRPGAQRTVACIGKRLTGETGLASRCGRVWWLTGTPAPNDNSDLYPYLRLMGAWDHTLAAFLARFTKGYDDGYRWKITGNQNVRHLRELIKPHSLRRRKEEVMSQLPPVRHGTLTVSIDDLEPEDIDDIREMQTNLPDELREAIKSGDIEDLAAIQNVTTLRRSIGIAKAKAAAKLAHDMIVHQGVRTMLVFGMYKQPITLFRDYLAEKRIAAKTLWGGTPPAKREALVEWFQKDDAKVKVLVSQIVAGGVGLNLTAAQDVVILEPSWIPAENAQAIARAHRIGQKSPVMVQWVQLAHTLDAHVIEVIKRKSALTKEVIDG